MGTLPTGSPLGIELLRVGAKPRTLPPQERSWAEMTTQTDCDTDFQL